MKLRWQLLILIALVLTFVQTQVVGAPQKITSLTTSAKGQGTIVISDPLSGERKHDVRSIVVTLRENGDAEIVLVADMQLFARGRWTAPSDLSKGISLKINGGIVTGNANGSGKLLLRPDGKSIDKLNFDVKSTARSKVTVQFIAEKGDS
jgi:hypothetical protein